MLIVLAYLFDPRNALLFRSQEERDSVPSGSCFSRRSSSGACTTHFIERPRALEFLFIDSTA